jgi:hypothetical protein
MNAFRPGIATLVSVGLALTSYMQLSAQSAQSLAALTVPVERLPDGCRLEPITPGVTGAGRFVMHPGISTANPWIGAGRQYASSIRSIVDGPNSPTYGLSGPAQRDRSALDIEEAYRARYISAEHRIDVYGVRFYDPALALTASLNILATVPPQPPRIVFGATAVRVLSSRFRTARNRAANAEGERCLQVVTQYIAGLE